jgi:hypothetical protein
VKLFHPRASLICDLYAQLHAPRAIADSPNININAASSTKPKTSRRAPTAGTHCISLLHCPCFFLHGATRATSQPNPWLSSSASAFQNTQDKSLHSLPPGLPGATPYHTPSTAGGLNLDMDSAQRLSVQFLTEPDLDTALPGATRRAVPDNLPLEGRIWQMLGPGCVTLSIRSVRLPPVCNKRTLSRHAVRPGPFTPQASFLRYQTPKTLAKKGPATDLEDFFIPLNETRLPSPPVGQPPALPAPLWSLARLRGSTRALGPPACVQRPWPAWHTPPPPPNPFPSCLFPHHHRPPSTAPPYPGLPPLPALGCPGPFQSNARRAISVPLSVHFPARSRLHRLPRFPSFLFADFLP